MRGFIARAALFLVLFPGTLHAASAPLSAAEKDAIRRSISSNEAMIVRFEAQIDQLKKNSGSSGDPEKERRQAVSLEAKKAVVQDETKKLRARLMNTEIPQAPAAIPAPSQKTFEDLKGDDWSRMSEKERERFIYTGIGGLERQGVFVSRPPDDYLQAMDQVLASDPEMKNEYLDDLFVFCVHDAEPQTREGIRKLRERSNGKTL